MIFRINLLAIDFCPVIEIPSGNLDGAVDSAISMII